MLSRFILHEFYSPGHDDTYDFPYIKLLQPGRELVERYYAEKYQTKINFYPDVSDFIADLIRFLATVKMNSEPEYREACFVGTKSHATPIIYLREGGQEAFLFADSLGYDSKKIKLIQETCAVKVYVVKAQRQADLYSCYTDALILSRDCTAIDPVSKNYILPKLLSTLESRSSADEDFTYTLLPDELLKTSQLSNFFEKHSEKTDRKLHNPKNSDVTLQQFRSRYQGKNRVAMYLRMKGLKLANIIEIQFYLNQLSQHPHWHKDLKHAFIRHAKNELLSQGPVSLNQSRQGLYELSGIFFLSLQNRQEDLTKLNEILLQRSLDLKTNDTVNDIAENLLKMILDTRYWTAQGSIPEGIAMMQKKLHYLGETRSLEGKINEMRKIAIIQLNKPQNQAPPGGMLYFLFRIDTSKKIPFPKELYRFFIDDWADKSLLPTVFDEWNKFNNKSYITHDAPSHKKIGDD